MARIKSDLTGASESSPAAALLDFSSVIRAQVKKIERKAIAQLPAILNKDSPKAAGEAGQFV
jgi:hypothetical protein